MNYLDRCLLCDTLRNDADDGDECVDCGAVYPDLTRRQVVAPQRTAAAPVVPLASSPTSSDTRPHRQPGWFRNIQMHGGLDRGRRAR